MRKVLFTCFIMLLFVCNIDASGMSFNVSCPEGAAAGSTVSCTISASTTTSTSLCAMSAKLNITNATFVSFDQKISLYQNTSSGFVYDSTSCISSKTTIGILKIKMPNSDKATITYSSIQASDSSGTVKSTTSDVTKYIRVYDSNTNLKSISLNVSTITPKFESDTTSYKANVSSDVTSITISATAESSKSTVTGTGKKSLNYGDNKFVITVKSEDGKTKSYTLVVNRTDNRSTNNTLKSLDITDVKMDKSFSSATTSYTAIVPSTTQSIQINATLSDEKASFVNGYGPRNVNLQYGVNNVEVKVKAENENIKVYTIKVTREDGRSSNNSLKSLSVSNTNINFDKNTTTYNLSVKNDIETIEISAQAEDNKSIITGLGTFKLEEGNNEIKIDVKAENGSINTYTLNIKRLTLNESLSSNTNITKFDIKNYNISFSNDVSDYIIKLKDEEKLDINIELEDETSTFRILGNEELKDNSIVKIIVSSTDGSTKEYNLIIDKKNESNNMLYLIIIIIESIVIILLVVIIISKNKKTKDVTNGEINNEIKEESHE
ncbi:MAG: cadherin-like beta sandwich domain-containing protein [Bacilli bacterium]